MRVFRLPRRRAPLAVVVAECTEDSRSFSDVSVKLAQLAEVIGDREIVHNSIFNFNYLHFRHLPISIHHVSSSLFTPFVLFAHLVLLFGREVVLDVECFANVFGRFAFDHRCNCLACDVEQRFDAEIC